MHACGSQASSPDVRRAPLARPAQALKAERLVVSLPAADPTRKEVFYPVDTRMRVEVDVDLQVGAGTFPQVSFG